MLSNTVASITTIILCAKNVRLEDSPIQASVDNAQSWVIGGLDIGGTSA